jgi:alanyl-tRNA synthetase
MDALLKQTVSKFGGKGGGTKDFAQGGGLSEAKLEEALAFAAQSLA